MHSLNDMAVLNPNMEDCAKINGRIVNTSIQDNSRTCFSVNSADYDDKSG